MTPEKQTYQDMSKPVFENFFARSVPARPHKIYHVVFVTRESGREYFKFRIMAQSDAQAIIQFCRIVSEAEWPYIDYSYVCLRETTQDEKFIRTVARLEIPEVLE